MILAKGISSFGAGQLVGQNILTTAEMFQIASLYTATASTFFYIIYWIIGRKLEKNLVAEIAKKTHEMEEKPQIENMVQNYLPGINFEEDLVTPL